MLANIINRNSRAAESLFKPFTMKQLELTSRIVMAPMTRSFAKDGVPHVDAARYYSQRAANGVSLIITEGVVIDHSAAAGSTMVPRFFGEDALKAWKSIVDAVHGEGGKIMPQLWHVGTDRKPAESPNPEVEPIGPSGLVAPGMKIAEPMSESQIVAVIEAFAKAAATAQKLGFDGIELHGAHGYLIDQFLWKGTNQREDEWGGTIEGRGRFANEVVRACRKAVGPAFPIVLRFSQWKINDFNARLAQDPSELERILDPLVDAGVDIFHCSTRRFWQHEFDGSELNLAGWTKKITGQPTITVGSVGLDSEFLSLFTEGKGGEAMNLDTLLERLDRNEFDLVAIGRALLADPTWATKIKGGRYAELKSFTPDQLNTLE